jgi:CRP-like cAMP-binding protein
VTGTDARDLAEHPFFAGLDPAALALIARCAHDVRFEPGDVVFRTGEPADAFYVLRAGDLALEVHDPARGGLVLDTVHAGEVAGWSWLVPPHRWMFDARAVSPISAMAFDAVCLRGRCEADPALGYALLQRVAHVMYERMQDARVRLLDLYGGRG